MNFFNGSGFINYIDPIATYIGIGTFLFSLGSFWYLYFGENWRLQKIRKQAMAQKGQRDAILICDFLGKGAIDDATRYAREVLEIKDEGIFSINMTSTNWKSEEIVKIMEAVHKELKRLAAASADKIFLVVAAPTPVSLLIGAELANWGNIHMLHNKIGGTTAITEKYENWGPLKLPW